MLVSRRSLALGIATAPASTLAAPFFSKSLGANTEFFDWQHYANHNADLLVAGLKSAGQLRSHWLSSGIKEGRIAHPDFHAASYRTRYPDLQAAFGNNNTQLYQHYVTHGQYEGRDAKRSGALIARLGGVSISSSDRCAGAVDSLVFSGKECVNSFDHGRQIQTCCLDTRYEGCYNPTQAGSRSDGLGYSTSSQRISGSITNNGQTLNTSTRAAFWARPGETINDSGVYGCTANNTTIVSDYVASTSYALVSRPLTTLIRYDLSWVVGRAMPANSFMSELVTGYHTSDFSVGYEIVPENGYAARLRHMGDHLTQAGQERPYPTILITPDGSRAIGVYSASISGSTTAYATWLWRFGQNQGTNDCSKWTIVRRYQSSFSAGQTVSARCYIVVGQTTDVHQDLIALMQGRVS